MLGKFFERKLFSRRTSSVPKKVVSAQKVIQAGHDPIISISDARAYLARETANQRLESWLFFGRRVFPSRSVKTLY